MAAHVPTWTKFKVESRECREVHPKTALILWCPATTARNASLAAEAVLQHDIQATMTIKNKDAGRHSDLPDGHMHLQEMPTEAPLQKTIEPFRTNARRMPGSQQLRKRQVTNTYAHETMSDRSFLTTTCYVNQCRNTPCSLHSYWQYLPCKGDILTARHRQSSDEDVRAPTALLIVFAAGLGMSSHSALSHAGWIVQISGRCLPGTETARKCTEACI